MPARQRRPVFDDVAGRPQDAPLVLGARPVIVGAEDYVHGKPHPEPFLTAAALLGVEPGACLIFEDADAGITSAIAAGMAYVRIPQPRGVSEQGSGMPEVQ